MSFIINLLVHNTLVFSSCSSFSSTSEDNFKPSCPSGSSIIRTPYLLPPPLSLPFMFAHQMCFPSTLTLTLTSGQTSTICSHGGLHHQPQMEYSNERTWSYHSMSLYAMKMRTSVLNSFWKDHISDKDGLRGDMSPYTRRLFAAVPEATFSFAMTVMDKVEG